MIQHRMKVYPDTTLGEARDWLEDHIDEGARCPCCGRLAKIYKRKLSAGMARDLVLLYNRYLVVGDKYVNTTRDLDGKGAIDNSGTLSKLRHWDLIEGEGKAGFWRITEDGIRFVRGLDKIPRHVFLYHRRMIDIDEDEYVSIYEALGDKFDYDELMGS